jgi:hypothetical protein
MKKLRIATLVATLASLLAVTVVFAQAGGLTLGLSRDFGYGGFSGDIQGTFTLTASGRNDLARVQFFIDQTMLGEVARAPFKLQFVTDNYPPGVHSLYAIGYTADGVQLSSQTLSVNFVTASQGSKRTMAIILPVLAVVFGAILLAAIVPLLTGRKTLRLEPGAQRQYPLGGGICPKCGRPFAVHFYGLNLLGSKLDRCPYCGKWSLVRHAAMQALRAAEQAELEGAAAQVPEIPEEEKLKKELDDSKYQGL